MDVKIKIEQNGEARSWETEIQKEGMREWPRMEDRNKGGGVMK